MDAPERKAKLRAEVKWIWWHICNSSAQEVKAKGSRAQGQPGPD